MMGDQRGLYARPCRTHVERAGTRGGHRAQAPTFLPGGQAMTAIVTDELQTQMPYGPRSIMR